MSAGGGPDRSARSLSVRSPPLARQPGVPRQGSPRACGGVSALREGTLWEGSGLLWRQVGWSATPGALAAMVTKEVGGLAPRLEAILVARLALGVPEAGRLERRIISRA